MHSEKECKNTVIYLRNKQKSTKNEKKLNFLLTTEFQFDILLMHSEKKSANDLWKLSKKSILSSLGYNKQLKI